MRIFYYLLLIDSRTILRSFANIIKKSIGWRGESYYL